MMGLTHALIGAGACKLLGLSDKWYEIAIAMAFAVLPDIDHPSSFFGFILKPLSLRIYSKLGHRMFTHSVMFMAIALAPVLFTPYFKLAFVAIGSHLIADSLTYTGIPALWPYKMNFTILGAPVKTGSFIEIIISVICTGVVLLC